MEVEVERCILSEEESSWGRLPYWVDLLKWHIRPFCPRAFQKQNAIKWSSVWHTQNSLFQNTFNVIFVPLDILFQGFCPAQQGITEYSGNCVFCPECDLLSAVPWPRTVTDRVWALGWEMGLALLLTAIYETSLTVLLSFSCGKTHFPEGGTWDCPFLRYRAIYVSWPVATALLLKSHLYLIWTSC